MNGINLLMDSNIIIKFLAGDKEVQKYFLDFFPGFSFISELEVLSGTKFQEGGFEHAQELLQEYQMIEYLPEMKDIVINIRAQKSIKLPDAIIAATAIYYNLPLVSSDKGFNGIKGLNFIYHEPTRS